MGLLDGKVAVVTGGTKGIGAGVAQAFAREGATVTVAGRDAEAGEQVAKSLRSDAARFVTTDVVDPAATEALIDDVVAHNGRLDVVCHNAGIYPEHPIESMTSEDWHTVLDTNLTSAFWVTKWASAAMRQSGGKIVFMSSITGARTGGIPGLSHYAASKAGMNGFMRAAAVELAPDNITVNAIEPGVVLTDALHTLDRDGTLIPSIAHQVPLGRLATIDEVANVAVFLASSLSNYITGQSVIVDGGLLLPEVQL